MDSYEVDEDERQTDGKAGKVACTYLGVGGTEHYEYEESGQDCLYDETTGGIAVNAAKTIGSEA